MVKISMKKFNVFCRFEPVSFKVVFRNATTELHKTIHNILKPLTQLMKTQATVLLARPAPPLSISLLHNLSGRPFPPKNQ